jgi:radical SAM superfamily enzyme YgiQ (UPF0313 family)
MSVLLVNPPPLESVPARIVTPPLGLAYLSASLKAQGIEARVLDADALDLSEDRLLERIRGLGPKIIGVTAMTPTVEAAHRSLELLRPVAPFLALGGPHASALGSGVFEDCPVRLDAVVCGEAEHTLPELAGRVISGDTSGISGIPGVLVPGEQTGEADWPRVENLDGLPFPDRDSLPTEKYRHPLFGSAKVTTMISSRGCPYHCIFCDKHTAGSAWRPRSAENVLAELHEVSLERGIKRIIFYDDLFTLDRKRVIDICKGIVELGLDIKWKCEGRVNRVDPETLAWMKRAGCTMIAYGVETATDHGLEFIRKDITVDQAREAFAMTRKAGIQTLGYFILGIPGETIEDEMRTVRLAIDLKADYAQFGVISPFPGTPLYDLGSEKGWVHDLPARGPAERGGRRPVLLDGYWTLERLDEIVRRAHRTFYFRPGYLVERLANVRSADEVIAGATQAMRLAGWWVKSAVKRG